MFCGLICVTVFVKPLSCCLTKSRHPKAEKSLMRKNETIWFALIGHNLTARATGRSMGFQGAAFVRKSNTYPLQFKLIDICVVLCFSIIKAKHIPSICCPIFRKVSYYSSCKIKVLCYKQTHRVTTAKKRLSTTFGI